MAFNHRIFVVPLMNIDYHHDYNDVIYYDTFLNKHCYTCMQPEEDLKSIQQQEFSFLSSMFLTTICFERGFKQTLNISQNLLSVLNNLFLVRTVFQAN